MSDVASAVEFERLLAHREWVRAVARSLAIDAATADDLEQETWLEALRAPPTDDRNLRGWLGRVLRNRAKKRGRGGARRAAHEHRAAHAGSGTRSAPATADVVSKAEAQQRIVRAVLDLEEPYRTTILLRFYERLPPREIAAQMGVPTETVRTRVRRATGRLRESLGGEGLLGWTAVVFPLIGKVALSGSVGSAGSVASTTVTTGGALAVEMKKTFVIATWIGLLLGGGVAVAVSYPFTPTTDLTPPSRTGSVPEGRATDSSSAAIRRRVARPKAVRPAAVERAPLGTDAATEDEALPSESASTSPKQPKERHGTKRDPALAKAEKRRQAVRKFYEGEKRGAFTTHDLAYWVDVKKLDDSRWKIVELTDPNHERGLQLHARWSNEASSQPGMTIDVFIVKHLHSRLSANVRERTTFSMPFDNIGKSVKASDVEGLIDAFYEDWRRGSTDVIERKCKKPRKSKFKVPKFEAAATATPKEAEERVRREWYLWADGKQNATYRLEIHYGPATLGKDALMDKGPEFVKRLRELKDKRVEWPRNDDAEK